jgi:hypothetical protein
MQDKVTKQTLHAKFTVEFTLSGKAAETFYSDFGGVDFGE